MKVIIFGAGGLGRKALLYYGIANVAYFADNDICKAGKHIEGIPIISFQQLLDLKEKYTVVIAVKSYISIRKQLSVAGITDIIIFGDDSGSSELTSAFDETYRGYITAMLDTYAPSHKTPLSDKALYVGCNTDTANYGCRATSEALYQILSTRLNITDIIYRDQLLDAFGNANLDDDVFLYAARIKYSYPELWEMMRNRIAAVGAVIINGEGSFIFQSPHRPDLHNMAVIMLICAECDVPYYVVNAMMSDGKNTDDASAQLYNSIISILRKAAFVSVRDKVSYDMISGTGIRLTYYPDALFSWYDYYEDNRSFFDELSVHPECILPFEKNQSKMPQIDLTHKYILFSGNSYAAQYPQEAAECFRQILRKINDIAGSYDLKLYMIECCVGDSILRRLSAEEGIPLITVDTNIRIAGHILGGAELFISGRYHPSILASLGGAECVFMDSNSHKTSSIQQVLGLDEVLTFPAMPVGNDAEHLIDRVHKCISRGNINKDKIRSQCRSNMLQAKKLVDIFEVNYHDN